MKKLHTVISLILFLALFVTVFLPGCGKQEDLDNAKYKITKTGTSSWDIAAGKKGKVKVECFLFPRSAGLEKKYQKLLAAENDTIAVIEKQKEKITNPEFIKSTEEELQLRREGRLGKFTDSWPNCKTVVVILVLTEKFNKVTIVCRPDSKSLDIALNMQSKQELSPHGFLRIAREIVQQLDKKNVDWSELPVSDIPLYDNEGEYMPVDRMPKEYLDFYKDAVFPAQH